MLAVLTMLVRPDGIGSTTLTWNVGAPVPPAATDPMLMVQALPAPLPPGQTQPEPV